MQAIYTNNEASPMVHPVISEAQYAIDKIGETPKCTLVLSVSPAARMICPSR